MYTGWGGGLIPILHGHTNKLYSLNSRTVTVVGETVHTLTLRGTLQVAGVLIISQRTLYDSIAQLEMV